MSMNRSFWTLPLCLWSIASVCAAAENKKEEKKTQVNRIEIRLNGDSCDKPRDDITVVLDNDDENPLTAHKSGKVWIWEDEPVDFDPEKGHVSVRYRGVRYAGVRTRCR